jgi:hypothetical protein
MRLPCQAHLCYDAVGQDDIRLETHLVILRIQVLKSRVNRKCSPANLEVKMFKLIFGIIGGIVGLVVGLIGALFGLVVGLLGTFLGLAVTAVILLLLAAPLILLLIVIF